MSLRTVTLAALLAAFAAPALAQPVAPPAAVTRAEAEAMTPQQIAARFLADEIAPQQAVHVLVGSRWGGVLDVIRLSVAPAPVAGHPEFCRHRSYAINFALPEYEQGASPPRLVEAVTVHSIMSFDGSYSSSENGVCMRTPPGGVFMASGDLDEIFPVVIRFRELTEAARTRGAGQGLALSFGANVEDEISAHIGRASLMEIRPARGAVPGRQSTACQRPDLRDCYSVVIGFVEPFAGIWRATLDFAAARPALHIEGPYTPPLGLTPPPPPPPETRR